MISVPDRIITWQIDATATRIKTGKPTQTRFELREIPVPDLKTGEVLVEVAGCSLGHVDYNGAVKGTAISPRHEISGQVLAGDPSWTGKEVLIPAVIPCRSCQFCMDGQAHLCVEPRTVDINNGTFSDFSSHIIVSSQDLCGVENRVGVPPLEHMAGIGAAVGSGCRAARLATLEPGDNVMVVGLGHMGQHLVQVVKALGAGAIVAVDDNAVRLQNMLGYGADFVIRATDPKAGRLSIDTAHLCDQNELPKRDWKILQSTDSQLALETALNLAAFASRIVIAGPDAETVAQAMKQYMDAGTTVTGSWGCLPEDYRQAVELVTSGKVLLTPFLLTRPMSWIQDVFTQITRAMPDRRIILTADDFGLDDSPEPKSCR